jgi:hypothetical protein
MLYIEKRGKEIARELEKRTGKSVSGGCWGVVA